MLNVNDHLKKSLLRTQQLKNQKMSQQRREQEVKRKMDTRRHIIIGELVCRYFPDLMNYQPQRNKADTQQEFAVFENILRILASNADLISQLESKAVKITSEGL